MFNSKTWYQPGLSQYDIYVSKERYSFLITEAGGGALPTQVHMYYET